MTEIAVALVDDHPVVLAGVRALLEATPDIRIAGQATSGAEAVQLVHAAHPDIAVIDISLPDVNGIDLAKTLREECPEVKILVLTVHEDASYPQLLFQLGVRGYVLKRSAADDLLEAIHVVARGDLYLDPVLAEKTSDAAVAPGKPDDEAELSPREQEVLRLAGQGFSNKEIAAFINVGIKSVETYKARAAEKLGLRTRSEIVRYAVARGWLHPVERGDGRRSRS